jgi:hypothetical protein
MRQLFFDFLASLFVFKESFFFAFLGIDETQFYYVSIERSGVEKKQLHFSSTKLFNFMFMSVGNFSLSKHIFFLDHVFLNIFYIKVS